MAALPLYPVTTVGSWPRPASLLRALKRRSPEAPAELAAAREAALGAQLRAGVDVLTEGEQGRDNFYSFLAERIRGLRLMTMADLLDHVEDKAAFEAMLEALDVPAFAIKTPIAVSPLEVEGRLVADEVAFVRERAPSPHIKATLPGPYLLSRTAWVEALSAGCYPTRRALADAIVRVLRAEIEALAAEGVTVVQLDEPVLSELAFAGKSSTRTFMCAALAAQASPEEELALAVEVINRCVEGIEGLRTAVHVCRGNWSRRDEVLLSGGYEALMPTLKALAVDQLVLEYATPRAGRIEALAELPASMEVSLGVVNPRTEAVEAPEAICARVREAREVLGAERIWLNPDCGFGTFASRPVNSAEVAERKLEALVAAARALREEG